jgi:hypothetical protein
MTVLLEKAHTSSLTDEEKSELKQLFAGQGAGEPAAPVSARGSH